MRKIFIALAAIVFISACLGAPENYKIKFAGMDVNFRADLNKAEKVLLEPGTESIRQVFFENPVSIVRIAFSPKKGFSPVCNDEACSPEKITIESDEKNLGYYGVAGFEIQYKTVLAYKQFIFTDKAIVQDEGGLQCVYFEKLLTGGIGTQRRICFETVILNSTDEAVAMANETAPVILMEASAETTKVSVENNLVRIMGKDMSQTNRKYTDLDLAADKFLLVLLNESIKK